MVWKTRLLVLEKTAAPATIVIFDGEPVVGQVLELLLRIAGYDVMYVDQGFLSQPGKLHGVRVLLLGPGWNSESRELAAEMVRSNPPMAERTPVLEIGLPPDGVPLRTERYVPWPCRTEDLKRRINDALLADSEPAGDALKER